ncbi:hypothetical protein ACO0QE_004572 [Hanseniaspora vineae]
MQADFNGAFSNKPTENEKSCEDFLAMALNKLDTLINSLAVVSNYVPKNRLTEFQNYSYDNSNFQNQAHPDEVLYGDSNRWNQAYGNQYNVYKMIATQPAALHSKREDVDAYFALNNLNGPIKHPNGSALSPANIKARLAKHSFKGFDRSAWTDKNTKFFVIKSNSAQNILISQEHEVWASTKLGNARLSKAFDGGNCNVILFYSECGSGAFCGVGKMMSDIKSKEESKDLWSKKEIWTRNFEVNWLVTKVVPNKCFRHLPNPENENKPVYQSRDTQFIPFDIGVAVLNIMESHPPKSPVPCNKIEYAFTSKLKKTNKTSTLTQLTHTLPNSMFQRSTNLTRRSFSVLAPLKKLPTKPLADEALAKSTPATKLKQFKPLSADQKAYLDRVIRVDQAGELGADYIYAGQYFVLAHKYPHLKPVLKHMWDQEVHHHNTFDALQVKHNVRPSLITPLWKVGAFAMGAGTALISPQAAMACTEAVETVIGGHYNDQLRALHKNFNLQLLRSAGTTNGVATTEKSEEIEELINTIRVFRDDELEHLDTAIKYDSHAAVPYMLLTEGIKTICRVAVFTAERI